MPEDSIELEEVSRGGRKWLEPRITLGNVLSIVGTALVGAGLYYGIVGNLSSQAGEIADLKVTVQQVPALAQHMAVIDNTISLNGQARDKQADEVAARLDGLTVTVNVLAQNVAALTATIKALDSRP